MTGQPVDPHVDVFDFELYEAFLDDVRVPYAYLPSSGQGIPRIETEAADGWWHDPHLVTIRYCPWCGRRLEAPTSSTRAC